MAPYEGDRHRKEKDALNLIIKMKKQNQSSSSGGQIILFVVMPLILALVIMRYRDIQIFAQQNKQVSAVIKIFYPAWKTYDELYPPLPPEQETEAEGTKSGKPGGAEPAAKGGKGSSKYHSKGSTKHGFAQQQGSTPEPEETAPRHMQRGSLLNK